MTNLAAILPSAKTPLTVQSLPTPSPSPNELLIKNEIIALNPVEYKIAKLDIFPHLKYPAVIGSTYGGTVASIGSQVTGFKVGERIVVGQPKFGNEGGNEYRAYQRYVLVNVGGRQDSDSIGQGVVTKAPDSIDLPVLASIMMNALCVPGLFSARLGLDRPDLDNPSTTPQPKTQKGKILIYGGSTSFGSLAIQFLSRAGYSVITTSSPPNHAFVSNLGADIVIDHQTPSPDEIAKTLISHGPYDVVVDMVSTPPTITLTARVLAALGGGKIYTTQPSFSPEESPDGVERVFEPWSDPLHEEANGELLKWVTERYLPEGISRGFITPMPVEKVEGGLRGIDGALERLKRGVSGVRLVVDPWE